MTRDCIREIQNANVTQTVMEMMILIIQQDFLWFKKLWC